MVTTCLARSRNFPLDVELAVEFRDRPSYMSTFEEVAIDIVPHSKRWRRLDVSFAYNIYLTFSHHLAFHGGSRIIEEIRLLKAPMLESLYIRSNGTTDSLYKGYQDFARWDTPALRCVTAVHFFPIYLPALKNVTHLDLTLILNQINYDDLFRELSRMVSLVDLRLKLDRCRPFNIGVQQSALKLPSVKRLILEFEADSPSDSLAGLLKTVLFRSLSFPGAHELHVKMYVVDFAKERSLDTNDERAHVSLNKEMAHIFSNISQFPLVERFVLGVFGVAPAHEDEGTRNLKKGLSGELSIPLDFLPSVKHFTLQSNAELLIAAVEDIERVYDLGLPVLRKPSDMLPALETITIDMPEAALAATWVSDILRRQKERPGGWGEFRKLVVVTDDGGDSERRSRKMRRLCTREMML